jgi:hypothetical protein
MIELKRYFKNKFGKNIEEKLEVCYKTREIFYINARQTYMKNQNMTYNESNLVTIQDKLNYLTIHEFPDYKSRIVDKINLHKYSQKILGKDICVPILKIYKHSNEINLNELPEQFVLKCNHGVGMNIICKNKKKFNITTAKDLLNNWMSINYGQLSYEFQYLNIKNTIFAEKYLKDDIEEYKVYCFHGEPKFISVEKKIEANNKIINYYDLDWKLTDIETGFPYFYRLPDFFFQKPKKLNIMIEYAKQLSSEFVFVRVDFYEIDENVYLRQLTFTPFNANFRLKNIEQSIHLGNLIDIKKMKNNFS